MYIWWRFLHVLDLLYYIFMYYIFYFLCRLIECMFPSLQQNQTNIGFMLALGGYNIQCCINRNGGNNFSRHVTDFINRNKVLRNTCIKLMTLKNLFKIVPAFKVIPINFPLLTGTSRTIIYLPCYNVAKN